MSGDRVKNVKSLFADTSNAERPIKGVVACLCEIDCAEDFLYRCHRCLLSDHQVGLSSRIEHISRQAADVRHRVQPRCLLCFRMVVERADVTPSVHGGASLAGNESARTWSISLS